MKHLFTLFTLLGVCSLNNTLTAQNVPSPDKTGMNLTAQEWNKNIVAGWNLGNSLESSPNGWDGNSTNIGWKSDYDKSETSWGNPKVSKAMIDAVKAAGFNAVRIPVRWACHITDKETMTVSDVWMARVKEVVDYCINNEMYVILNTHHDMWLEYTPVYKNQEDNNKKLKALWTNIANYFADYDDHLAFAGTNEVHIKDNWSTQTAENLAVQNSYNQTFVDAVRATGGKNCYRHLIVQTYRCDPYAGMSYLVVPTDIEGNDNKYMSVEFHYYNPYNYCSGNSGSGFYNYWGKEFKNKGYKVSNEDESSMIDFLNKVVNTWGKKGLGIVIGEWGVSDRWTSSSDKESIHENMTYYCKYLVSESRKRGISTFVWDNNSFGSGSEKYGIFNRQSNMAQKATWILKGIMEGAGQVYEEPDTNEPPTGDDIYSKLGTVIWSGEGYMNWGDGLQLTMPASDFAELDEEGKIVFYYTLDPTATYRMIQFFFGGWSANPELIYNDNANKEFDLSAINGGAIDGDVYNAFGVSAADLKEIKQKGLVAQGYGATLTKVIVASSKALGIKNIVNDNTDDILYDLSGRVATSDKQSQIYIKGKSKYLVK